MSSALNGLFEDVTRGLRSLEPVKHVLEDPALPQVTGRIAKLHALEAKSVSKASGGRVSESQVKGVGLARLVPALDAYIFYRKNPWVLPAVGLGAILLIKALRK